MSKRILLAALGSHGDLNPMIAIAQALADRGASPTIGCSPHYRAKVLAAGLPFAPIRPDMPDPSKFAELAREMLDPKAGARALVEGLVMPHLRDAWVDTMAAAQGQDALVGGALCMAVPMASAKLGIPWASAVLQPMAHLSAHDPPAIPQAMWIEATRGWGRFGAQLRRLLFLAAKLRARGWCSRHARLRRELGLPPEPDPLFAASRSPWLSLAMFPSSFAAPQPDWPPSSVECGFPIARPNPDEGMPAELLAFLDSGPAPLAFTLGTAAVHAAGSFYAEGKAAASALGRRAVFLTGPEGANAMGPLPDGMIAVPYAPHLELFPRCAAVVHSCGIGTCAASLLSGAPTLAAPWAHDQPDNARRLAALGVARVLPRAQFNRQTALAHLRALLATPSHLEAARQLAALESARPNGAANAAEALLARL